MKFSVTPTLLTLGSFLLMGAQQANAGYILYCSDNNCLPYASCNSVNGALSIYDASCNAKCSCLYRQQGGLATILPSSGMPGADGSSSGHKYIGGFSGGMF